MKEQLSDPSASRYGKSAFAKLAKRFAPSTGGRFGNPQKTSLVSPTTPPLHSLIGSPLVELMTLANVKG